VKFILGLACAFKAHSSCILLAMALVVGPLARSFSSIFQQPIKCLERT